MRCCAQDYLLIWLALVLAGLYCRPLMPVDETRVVSVAWDMWQRGDLLVPYLNGQPYSHKPPLLQWCIHLLWWLFGVGETPARLAAPLFALGNLALTAALARRLWPDDAPTAKLAPLILLAMPVWALWTSLTLYDMPVTFFTLLGLYGIVRAAEGQDLAGWGLLALAIAGGALAKGPVILILILPPAFAAPWWRATMPPRGRWWGGLLGAVLAGAALALAWAVPAGLAGGAEYRQAIFWGQSAGRISHSFAHALPFWWYFALLPALGLPWLLWPPLWRSLRSLPLTLALSPRGEGTCSTPPNGGGADAGLRFCAIQIVVVLLVFSLISGKRVHYLLPIFPAAALCAARALSRAHPILVRRDALAASLLLLAPALTLLLTPLAWDADRNDLAEIAAHTPLSAKLLLLGLGLAVWLWRPPTAVAGARLLAVALLALLLTAHGVFRHIGWHYYDLQTFADHLAAVEQRGAPIAHWREYHGDFNFLGRLRQPLTEIDTRQGLLDWMQAHRQGYVVLLRPPDPALCEEGAEFAQYYRGGRRIMLWPSAALLARPGVLERLLGVGGPSP
ncbi:MAG: ArnT family glycosyltransferase [Candidatus Methylumidiphilus sp.]